jgi:hypothetical protein
MNKITGIPIWHVLLASLTMFVLAGCGITTPTFTPTLQSLTVVPSYIHYTPAEGVNIHVEFDYPGSWIFSENTQYADFIVFGLGDPRFLALPTLSPEDHHPTPSDFGDIVIWITPRKPSQTPETELSSHKQSYKNEHLINLLKDYKLTIDRHDASALEYQINDPESYTSLMFARRIFFVVKDQMYEIYFTVAEKERGGEFEKGYEYFFKSLKIVPEAPITISHSSWLFKQTGKSAILPAPPPG